MNLLNRIPKTTLRIIAMSIAFALIFGSMFVFSAADGEEAGQDEVVSGSVVSGEVVVEPDEPETDTALQTDTAPKGVVAHEETHTLCAICGKCRIAGCDYSEGVCDGTHHVHSSACVCRYCGGRLCSGDCMELDSAGTAYVACDDCPATICNGVQAGVATGCHEHTLDCECELCHECQCREGICWQQNPNTDENPTYTSCAQIGVDSQDVTLCDGHCHIHSDATCAVCPHCGGKTCEGLCFKDDGTACDVCPARTCPGSCHTHNASCECVFCGGCKDSNCYANDGGTPCSVPDCVGGCHAHNDASCGGVCPVCGGCLCEGCDRCYRTEIDPNDPTKRIVTGRCTPCSCSAQPPEDTRVFTSIKVYGDSGLYLSEAELAQLLKEEGSIEIDIDRFCRLNDQNDLDICALSDADSVTISATAKALSTKYGTRTLLQVADETIINLDWPCLYGGKAGDTLHINISLTATRNGVTKQTEFVYPVYIYNNKELSNISLVSSDETITGDAVGTAKLKLYGTFTGKPTVEAKWMIEDEIPVKSCTYNEADKSITITYSAAELASQARKTGDIVILVCAALNNNEVFCYVPVRVIDDSSRIASVKTSDGYSRYVVEKDKKKQIVVDIEYANGYHGGAVYAIVVSSEGVIKVEDKSLSSDNTKIVLDVTGLKSGETYIELRIRDGGDPYVDELTRLIDIVVPETGVAGSAKSDACIVLDPAKNITEGKDFVLTAKGWFSGGSTLDNATVCYVPESWQINPSGEWMLGNIIELDRSVTIPGLKTGDYTATVLFRRMDRNTVTGYWEPSDMLSMQTRSITIEKASTGGTTNGSTKNPDTADSTAVNLVAIIMLISGLAILALLCRERIARLIGRKSRLANAVRR